MAHQCMRNDTHKHLPKLKQKHTKMVCLALPQGFQIERQKHMKQPLTQTEKNKFGSSIKKWTENLVYTQQKKEKCYCEVWTFL